MKLIVGLGNIGKEYEDTRHNVGFNVLDYILGDIHWEKNNNTMMYKNNSVIYIKPLTYMNLSGNAVRYICDYYKIEISDILVIQDDISLPIGKIRIKKNSSDGGHNGIKNIISCLKSKDFLRIKVGVSSPKDENIVDYVLGKFSKEDNKILAESYEKCKNIIVDFIANSSSDELMNRYN